MGWNSVSFFSGRRGQAGRGSNRGDGRQFAATRREEGPLNVVIPLDGIEDANRPLRLDKAIAKPADHALVGGQLAVIVAIDPVDVRLCPSLVNVPGTAAGPVTLCSVT